MLAGRDRRRRVRSLKLETIRAQLRLVHRLAVVSNQYPWQWTAGEMEAFFAHLRAGSCGFVRVGSRLLSPVDHASASSRNVDAVTVSRGHPGW